MPSGIETDFTVSVKGGGITVEIKVDWPEMLWDANLLHEPFKLTLDSKKTAKGFDSNTCDYLTKYSAVEKHLNDLSTYGLDGAGCRDRTSLNGPCT